MPTESPKALLEAAASGAEIELDDAVLATDSVEQANEIAELAAEIAELYASGYKHKARSLARIHAKSYLEPRPVPVDYSEKTPAELANLILRRPWQV